MNCPNCGIYNIPYNEHECELDEGWVSLIREYTCSNCEWEWEEEVDTWPGHVSGEIEERE